MLLSRPNYSTKRKKMCKIEPLERCTNLLLCKSLLVLTKILDCLNSSVDHRTSHPLGANWSRAGVNELVVFENWC